MMRILFTICGRAGSKGVKNKNLMSMNNIPLVFYTLGAIQGYKESHPEDEIEVAINTDSDDLWELANSQKTLTGIKRIVREKDLAGDIVAKADVIRDTYLKTGKEFDAVIDLDITSPMRRLSDIENAISIFGEDRMYDVVFSVVKARRSPYFNMVEKKDGYYKKICVSDITSRQQSPEVYEMNASIYVYRPDFLKNELEKPITDYNCCIVEMPDYLVLDIDSQEDFEMMQMLYGFYLDHDEGLQYIRKTCEAMVGRG